MKKSSLQARIDQLKAMPAMRDMYAIFEKIYGALWEMDCCNDLGPGETVSSRRAAFIREQGTKEDFVKTSIDQWNRRHRKGGMSHEL